MGYSHYTQLVGGSNTVPSVDEGLRAELEGRVTSTALNFVVVGEKTSAILRGSIPLPEQGPLIQITTSLTQNNTALNQVQSVCCEAILCFIFDKPDPSLLERLFAYEGTTAGNIHSAYYPFTLARKIYMLASVDQLQDPSRNLLIAEKAIHSLKPFAESSKTSENFCMFGVIEESTYTDTYHIGLPYRMVEACRLEQLEQYLEALSLLEKGIEDALLGGPTLILGMAYEQAGKLVKKWTGSDRLSMSFLVGSFQTYKDYGAIAKCAHMLSIYPGLRTAPSSSQGSFSISSPAAMIQSGSDSSGSNSATSDSVDLATVRFSCAPIG